VSGPAFLGCFLGLAAVILLGTALHRARLVRVRRAGGRPKVTPEQAAPTAEANARCTRHSAGYAPRGAIGLTSDGTLTQTGPLPDVRLIDEPPVAW
jgi:hypothetical protein